METTRRLKRLHHRSMVAGLAAVIAAALAGSRASSQAPPSADDIAAGMRIYRQKGDCQACHGWAADGRKMDSQMPDGANLRTTLLDRNKLIVAIKCGRPGRGMPAFDRLAYSDGRCFNMTDADLKAVFAYLRTVPAISNKVPEPTMPAAPPPGR